MEKGPLAVDPLSARIVERLRREATESPPPAQGKRPPAQAASEPETRAEGESAAPARRELPSAAASSRAHATHAAAPRPQLESGDSPFYDRVIFLLLLVTLHFVSCARLENGDSSAAREAQEGYRISCS